MYLPVCAAAAANSVMSELTRRFTEADVAMMLTLLNAVGLQLRGADPSSMKVGGSTHAHTHRVPLQT